MGRARDPLGNIWWIQTHAEDVDPAELQRRAADEKNLEAMAYVQTSLDEAMARSATTKGGLIAPAFGAPSLDRAQSRECSSATILVPSMKW